MGDYEAAAIPSDVQVQSSVGDVLAQRDVVEEASSLASIDRPPSELDNIPAPKVYRPFSLPVLALLAPASIFGTLARLGLSALVTYDGQSIFSLAYAQTIGCFIMGFALELKEPLGDFYGPLYTAMTTGFCGSLTTFSGWQQDIFDSWINSGDAHRDWLRDVVDGITKTAGTFGLSLAALKLGAHLSSQVRPLLPRMHLPARPVRYSFTVISVLIYAATLPAYFRLPASFRHQATAALLFSYPGTLTRYFLSIKLNPLSKALPLGTFTANMFGTALLAAFHVLQNVSSSPVTDSACAILQGLLDGYCGCLTTVSTFAAEIASLATRKAWRYALLSWAGGQLLILVIQGPSFWSAGVDEQRRCSFA